MMGIHRNGLDMAIRKDQPSSDYYRENNMPDSPENKLQSQTSAVSPTASNPITISRSLSTTSSFSGMNGAHSPHSSVNGRTPSPPSMANSGSGQQLPPACGARQLSKLKRFLTTLQQFGSDISPEIGERVRTLVLGLVNSHLSIEEFHAKLQEATNFPLRPFVIPFLKANLPLLQRELLHCARMAKQTPQQYLAHNDHILFDTSHSPVESQELVMSADINENGKRRASPDRPKENGSESAMEPVHPAKRHHPLSPGTVPPPSRVSPNSSHSLNVNGPIRLEDISMHREMRERERMERERLERERADRERHLGNFGNYHRPEHYENSMLNRIDDDWKHVETMLHCIIDMVDKTKRALAVLQERSSRDREELSMWMRRHAEGLDQDMKKRTSEMMASTLRQTEDRVAEVKRRAEEAVNEVKRQAVLELQKAVAAAEQKANELVTAERAKMERTLGDAQKQAQDEILSMMNTQEESSESCWNCGRKASETCSGCNIARYCGSFCQHKDWENHHHVCGQANNTRSGMMGGRSSSSSNPANSNNNNSEASSRPSAAASTASASTSSSSETSSQQADSVPASAASTVLTATTVLPAVPSPISAATSPVNSSAAASNKSGSRSSTPAADAKPAVTAETSR